MGNNNQGSSPPGQSTCMCDCSDPSSDYNPNLGSGPSSSCQQWNQPMESVGRKEDGWRNGNCTRCGKTTFMCNCTGNAKELFWNNGNCEKCGKTTFMCICSNSTQNVYRPEQNPFNQQNRYAPAQVRGMEYGRKEDGWRDGKCMRCGKSSFMCDCKGEQREIFWENGKCRRCERSSFMCDCRD